MKLFALAVAIIALGAASPATADTVVGWGYNLQGEAGAGFRSGPLTAPVSTHVLGATQIVASYTSGYALEPDGSIVDWGGNAEGQLGIGSRSALEVVNPVQTHLPGNHRAVQLAAAGAHVIARAQDGTVWTWGSNFWGTSGDGTRSTCEGCTPVTSPKQVALPGAAVSVSAGGATDAVVLTDGSVYMWGEDGRGVIGDGSTEPKPYPTLVPSGGGATRVEIGGISSTGSHAFFIFNDGSVSAVGKNNRGQLGLGDTTDRSTITPVPGLVVRQLSTSASHTVAIDAEGRVLTWGNDESGELGYITPELCKGAPCSTKPRPTGFVSSTVAAGFRTTYLNANGLLQAFGYNRLGQVGDGTTEDKATPTPVVGIGGVSSVSGSERFTLAIAAEAPDPDFRVIPGPSQLTAEWAELPGTESWSLTWRPFTNPKSVWSPRVVLPVAQRSYTITGLEHRLYEVRLKRLRSTFGFQIAYGTPE